MGLSPETEIHEYWATEDRWVGNAGIASICTRDAFEHWNDIFHFDLDWLVERCVVNSKAHWHPFERLSVDEWLQPWKGTSLLMRKPVIRIPTANS